MVLGVVWMVLVWVKDRDRRPEFRLIPFPGEQPLSQFVQRLREDSAVLTWLWDLLPTWDWIYTLFTGGLWMLVGAKILISARELYEDIRPNMAMTSFTLVGS